MSIDHSQMRLGKRPRRHDSRTLKIARYMTSAIPPAPPKVDYTRGITDWGMMLNDRLSCCTTAAVGHAVQTWTANALGRELTVPDSAILNYYQRWDGYNPAVPASDQGGVELDVLNDWRQQGFNGESLDAFVEIGIGDWGLGIRENPNPQSPTPNPIAQAVWLFGGAYIGVELPITAQTQDLWDVADGPDAEPGSWGGHAVYLVGYDLVLTQLPIADCRSKQLSIDDCRLTIENPSPHHRSSIGNQPSAIDNRQSTISCITWGQVKKMTWAWFQKYCSEAYALVSKDWIEASGLAPSGFDLATLEGDLEAVSNRPSALRYCCAAR